MTALILSAFAFGLVTSVHCVSMCGPMVVTYAAQCNEDDRWQSKVAPNLAYQGAKLVSYMLVGAVLGAVGSAIDFDSLRPWVMAAAGVFMIILGLGMTGKVPWAARLSPRPPKILIRALTNLRRRAKDDAAAGESSLGVPLSLGLLTGLMPCAPLQAAELMAATSGNALSGALVMAAFGVGTMPLLLAFGMASSLVPNRWKARLHLGLAVVVMISGLVFLNRAALLVGFPINSTAIVSAFSGGGSKAETAYVIRDDGVAEVTLIIADVKYYPSTLIVPADTPIVLTVDRREANTCSDRLVIPGLGIDAALTPNGTVEITIPPVPAGTYQMTCQMGMMSGEFVARTR